MMGDAKADDSRLKGFSRPINSFLYGVTLINAYRDVPGIWMKKTLFRLFCRPVDWLVGVRSSWRSLYPICRYILYNGRQDQSLLNGSRANLFFFTSNKCLHLSPCIHHFIQSHHVRKRLGRSIFTTLDDY